MVLISLRPFLLRGVCVFLLLSSLSTAATPNINLTFYTTSSLRVTGALPTTYLVGLINNGSAAAKVTLTVTITLPDKSTSQLLLTQPTIAAGASKQITGQFITGSFTSATGDFSIAATVADKSGTVLAQQSLAGTIVPVPQNGIFASIGGQGPDTQVVGYTSDFSTVTANFGSFSKTLRTRTTLVETDGTEVGLDNGTAQVVAPGSILTVPGSVTTSQYSDAPGYYSVRTDVLDSGNNVVATDSHSFLRTALPTNLYPPVFADQATTAGINVPRGQAAPPTCGTYPNFVMGGAGAAVADYDGDGWDDLYVNDQASGLGHLWHNNANGTFTDMALAAGIPVVADQSGSSFADVDNDGYPDLLILVYDGWNTLLHNNGNGTFTNITPTAGLQTEVTQNNTSATWGDYDNDGYLDLYVTEHFDCVTDSQNDHLYHNNGNLTFTDVSGLLGGSSAAQLNGRGFVAMFTDYNQDGRPDLYVGNDLGTQPYSYPNVLWRNDGPDGHGGWSFTDVSASSGAGVAMSSMGIGISDFDRKGQFDFYVTNYGTNVMLRQAQAGTFAQVQADGFGGSHSGHGTFPNPLPGSFLNLCKTFYTCTSVGWGTGFYDFNDDGWEDIYMTGGSTHGHGPIYENGMLVNHRDGTFLDLTLLSGTSNTIGAMMPGAVFADFNHDGYMDIFQQGVQEFPATVPPNLFMNAGPASGNPNHWLEVKLVGTRSNHDGVGSKLVATVGTVNLLRIVFNGGTYQGNSTLVQHFGVGAARNIDSLTIYWPSGQVQTLANVTSNQILTVTEPQ
jgi:hypothetical protein